MATTQWQCQLLYVYIFNMRSTDGVRNCTRQIGPPSKTEKKNQPITFPYNWIGF